MEVLILFSMIFLHIVDDYYLQGVLAKMKQKSWWIDNCKENYDFYKYDYLAALFAHGFSWSFMITLPITVYSFYFKDFLNNPSYVYFWGSCVFLNAILHSWIDNKKANKKFINLVIDQTLHMFQIGMMFILLFIMWRK